MMVSLQEAWRLTQQIEYARRVRDDAQVELERIILKAAAKGVRHADIAEAARISVRTVRRRINQS